LDEIVMLDLVLPYPPSVNHYWRRVGTRTLISRGGRAFRTEVCSLLAGGQFQTLTGPLEVEVFVNPPDRRRRDIDNVQKALLDALQHGGVYADDSQIIKLSIEKGDPIDGGKTTVRIKEVSES
jgi:Holliday junction resolvase RusA-like endonuclease